LGSDNAESGEGPGSDRGEVRRVGRVSRESIDDFVDAVYTAPSGARRRGAGGGWHWYGGLPRRKRGGNVHARRSVFCVPNTTGGTALFFAGGGVVFEIEV